MFKRLLFIPLLFLIELNFCYSQVSIGHIKGSITNKDEKIDEVIISLIRDKDSTLIKTSQSQADGSFEFLKVEPGIYSLLFQKMGYKTFVWGPFEMTDASSLKNIPAIELQKQTRQLHEVVVKSQPPIIERRGDKTILHVENSVYGLGSSGLEILQIAPGVSVNSEGQISMKGKTGVAVYIDGRPSNLSGQDLTEYLKNIPTDNIAQIELLYTPSAKYDASGNAGIINIKFKKGNNIGTNGTYSVGGGVGRNYRYNAALSLNHRSKKSTFYSNLDFGKVKAIEDNLLSRKIRSSGAFYDIKNADLKNRKNLNLNLGYNYAFDANQSVGINANGFVNSLSSDEDNNTKIFTRQQMNSEVLSHSFENRDVKNGTANLNYTGVVGKSKTNLSADVDYLIFKRTSEELFESDYSTPPAFLRPNRPFKINSLTPSDIHLFSIKADVTQPLKKDWFFDAGFKYSLANVNSARAIATLSGNNPFPTLNSDFLYKENINAGYFSFRKKKEESNLQLQLRTEQTVAKGKNMQGENLINNAYWSLFPVFIYSKSIFKNDKMTFSYNRRLNRPDYQDLNPFFYFLDQYTYHQGNPQLNPSFANAYEMNYTFSDQYSISLQYNHIKNFFYTIYQQDDATGVAITSKKNYDHRNTVGFQFDIPQEVNKWWSMDLSMQTYYEFFKYTDEVYGMMNNKSFSGLASLNNSIKFGRGLNSMVALHYETPTAYGIFSFKPLYFASIGISKSIFKNAGSLRLIATDIFNTNSNRFRSDFYNLDLKAKEKVETQSFRVSFSYKLGKKSVKTINRNKTGVDEEKSRIKE